MCVCVLLSINCSSVLWHCWLDIRKSIWSVKFEWYGVGVVICLERGADCLHMVQLMPLIPKPHHLLPPMCTMQDWIELNFYRLDSQTVLWHCWLGARKSTRPVKIEWWGVGVDICLERGADCLHMVQLMPLHPHHLLPHLNPDWFYLSCTGLPRLSGKRGR